MKLFEFKPIVQEKMLLKDISYLELWRSFKVLFSRVEPFVQFGRMHHEEQFCEIILNLDQWFRRSSLIYSYLELWQSFCPFEQNQLCNFSRGKH